MMSGRRHNGSLIQMSDLRRLAIPLPTVEMQNKIVEQIAHTRTLREVKN
jgi:hypothetical protein